MYVLMCISISKNRNIYIYREREICVYMYICIYIYIYIHTYFTSLHTAYATEPETSKLSTTHELKKLNHKIENIKYQTSGAHFV